MRTCQSLLPIPTDDTDDDMSDAGAIAQLHTQAEEFISSLGQQWNLLRGITDAPSSSTDEELLVHYATPTPKPMPSSSKGKMPAPKSQTPAPSLAELAKLRAQMQQLELEKQAALKEVKKLQSKHARAESFLQETAATVHNTAVAADQQISALSQNTYTALEQIRQIILRGQDSTNRQFILINANLIWLKESGDQDEKKNDKRMTRLEQWIAALEQQPVGP